MAVLRKVSFKTWDSMSLLNTEQTLSLGVGSLPGCKDYNFQNIRQASSRRCCEESGTADAEEFKYMYKC